MKTLLSILVAFGAAGFMAAKKVRRHGSERPLYTWYSHPGVGKSTWAKKKIGARNGWKRWNAVEIPCEVSNG